MLLLLQLITNKYMDARKMPILKNYQAIQTQGIACTLGFGAYGTVQLGKNRATGEKVAIKRIGRKIAISQVKIHMQLNHPNIIKMLDYQFDEKQQCTFIILEYAEHGSVFECIRDGGLKDKAKVRDIFRSVCLAIDYMHSMEIMHRDIKPENILIGKNNVVKVCDFGFATHCQPRTTICGTVQYMAPQMILRRPYTHKIDIWGLGILLFQLIQGRAPFNGKTQDQVLQKMKKQLYFSKNFSKDEMDLVQKILKVDPTQRPQIKQILKNPCLRMSERIQISEKPERIQRFSNDSSKHMTLNIERQERHQRPERVQRFQLGQRISNDSTRPGTILNNGKRSTMEQDERHHQKQEQKQGEKNLQKRIKIIHVIDLNHQKQQKVDRHQKKNSYNIQITSIRNLDPEEQAKFNVVRQTANKQKPEKMERLVSAGNIPLAGSNKISLKKTKKN